METINNQCIEKAKKMADDIHLPVEMILHEVSGRSTDEAVIALGVDASDILKTLILYARTEQRFVGAIILGSDRLNKKSVAALAGVKKLDFASADQIEEVTGFKIGGVPALAVTRCNKAFIDRMVLEKEYVVGAGGDEHCGMRFSPRAFVEKVRIDIADLRE